MNPTNILQQLSLNSAPATVSSSKVTTRIEPSLFNPYQSIGFFIYTTGINKAQIILRIISLSLMSQSFDTKFLPGIFNLKHSLSRVYKNRQQ